MAQKVITNEERRTKEGNVVIPLDTLRSYDYGHKTIISGGECASSVLYSIGSGKEAYIKQIVVTELSGDAAEFRLADSQSGYQSITPMYKLTGGQSTVVDVCIGPITSGIHAAGYNTLSGTTFRGEITLVVQVDPQAVE
jgi:hypothetical protein